MTGEAMTALEKMKNWLTSFPLWSEKQLPVDNSDGIPEHCGLFCRGVEEISRRQDVLGNTQILSRLRFTLCRTAANSADNTDNANWLLALQAWIRQQSALGLAPVFGDLPHGERIWAENGKLRDASQAGTARYTADITVEFTNLY